MKKPSSSNVSDALGDILARRGMSQRHAASATGLSQPYFNQVVNGHRQANARWVTLVAETLKLTKHEKTALHRAAAKDHGFEIDLTKP